MPKITFISHSGESQEVVASIGMTVMEAAVNNGVDGVLAECGGACSCATCHVYVDARCASMLESPDELERDMLEMADNVRKNSRLACQLSVTEKLDGLVVTTPEY